MAPRWKIVLAFTEKVILTSLLPSNRVMIKRYGYCKRFKQVLDILHNRDRKPSPNFLEKSVLELHEHLTKEHTIGNDNVVQDM
jgi:hypothetical protein